MHIQHTRRAKCAIDSRCVSFQGQNLATHTTAILSIPESLFFRTVVKSGLAIGTEVNPKNTSHCGKCAMKSAANTILKFFDVWRGKGSNLVQNPPFILRPNPFRLRRE